MTNQPTALTVQQSILNGATAYVYQNKVECDGSRITMVNPQEMVDFLLNMIEYVTDEYEFSFRKVIQYPDKDDPDDLRFKIVKQ